MNAKHAKNFRHAVAAAAYVCSRNKWYLRLLKRLLPGLCRRLDARAMRAVERAVNAKTIGKSRELPETALSPKATTRETRARMPRTDKKEPRT